MLSVVRRAGEKHEPKLTAAGFGAEGQAVRAGRRRAAQAALRTEIQHARCLAVSRALGADLSRPVRASRRYSCSPPAPAPAPACLVSASALPSARAGFLLRCPQLLLAGPPRTKVGQPGRGQRGPWLTREGKAAGSKALWRGRLLRVPAEYWVSLTAQ